MGTFCFSRCFNSIKKAECPHFLFPTQQYSKETGYGAGDISAVTQNEPTFPVALFASGLFTLCSACAPQVQDVLTPRELNANSALYDGKAVSVKGFVMLGTNARSIFESELRFEEYRSLLEVPGADRSYYQFECLTLVDAEILMENSQLLDGKTLVFRGLFNSDYLDGTIIDLQACSRSALHLDSESTRRLILDLSEQIRAN